MYEIEPGIPIPKQSRPGRLKTALRDALLSMDPGDSFFVASAEERATAISSALWHRLRIETRRADKGGVQGYRIWLVGERKETK